MTNNTGTTDNNQIAVTYNLSRLLADENLLYLKTRNAHWVIEGSAFYHKYEFLETQLKQLGDLIDSLVEHIRLLGLKVAGRLRSFLDLPNLGEVIISKNSNGYLKELLNGHENIIMCGHENLPFSLNGYRNFGTSDFVNNVMETHKSMAWLLRSQLIKYVPAF